jgi:hypothetical protein
MRILLYGIMVNTHDKERITELLDKEIRKRLKGYRTQYDYLVNKVNRILIQFDVRHLSEHSIYLNSVNASAEVCVQSPYGNLEEDRFNFRINRTIGFEYNKNSNAMELVDEDQFKF